MNDQTEMMMDNIRQFAQANINDIALKIEREGVSEDLYNSLIQQGLIGANLPAEMGGAGLDRTSYDAILFQLARASPSVAFHVFMNNSIILKILEKASKKDMIGQIVSGKIRLGLIPGNIIEGSSEKSNIIIEPSKMNIYIGKENASLVDGMPELLKSKSLGLRGLKTDLFTSIKDGEKLLPYGDVEKIWNEASWDAAAIFLGISEGALEKAIEYTKVRKTFNFPLKDYEPVAFRLSELKSELEILKNTLFSDDSKEQMGMMLKTISAEFARRATKYALQFHGGYGYLEDFGVEKFYRDAVALNALMFRPILDKRALAASIYGEKSGYL